jgi:hypothetical protein
MKPTDNSVAFEAPGIEPRWTSSAKEGVGTAYHTSCRLWFTLSHGIVNEIYYPRVDQRNTRDFQFLISDGETFCHEEKRDLNHQVDYPEQDGPFYRLTNSEPGGRYRLVKHVLARWLGIEPAAGRFLALNTASLSALGHENNLSRPAIRFWNDTHHLEGKSKLKSKYESDPTFTQSWPEPLARQHHS